VLKNAVDWVSRPRQSTPFQNKPSAVIGASTGSFGAVWAQAELRKVLASAGARVVDSAHGVSKAHEAFDAEGALLSEADQAACSNVLGGLIGLVEARSTQAAAA